MELPENWYNLFWGFLICKSGYVEEITMTHMKGMDSQTEFSSSNLVDLATATCVVYVSFGLLRHTTWWDETSNAISFSIKPNLLFPRDQSVPEEKALEVRLIPRKTQSVPMETTDSSQFCRYVLDQI